MDCVLGPCHLIGELFINLQKSIECSLGTQNLIDNMEEPNESSLPVIERNAKTETVNRGTRDEGILAGEFYISSRNMQFLNKVKYQVIVTDKHVSFTQWSDTNGGKKHVAEPLFILFDEVTGCNISDGQEHRAKGNACYLMLYTYPRKKTQTTSGDLLKIVARKCNPITITFNKNDNYDANKRAALIWKNTILCLLKGQKINSETDLTALELPKTKRMLVLINPFSGPGKALSIFQEKVVPMFEEAGIHFNLVVTERAGHAYDMMITLKLEEWYGIIIVSGDGLVYEVVNGLMQRSDWMTAIKIPIGTIPGGSGNALSCSLNFYAGESYLEHHPLHAAYLIIKHTLFPWDIVLLETCTGKRIGSFLSVTWGYMSDVDIESEKYRAVGNARFTLGALVRLVGLRKYRGRISFLPVHEYQPRVTIPSKKKFRRTQSEHYVHDSNIETVAIRRATSVINEEVYAESSYTDSGENSNTDANIQIQNSTFGLVDTIGWESGVVTEQPGSCDDDKNTTGNNAADNKVTTTGNVTDVTDSELNGVSVSPDSLTSLLPPMSEPVPSNWVTIEDEFISIAIVYMTHLGPDLIFSQNRAFDEGEMDLYILHHSLSRARLLKAFLDLSEGNIRSSNDIERVRIKAFRLEPLTKKGVIAVDGEMVDYGPIQGHIVKGLGRIMGKNR